MNNEKSVDVVGRFMHFEYLLFRVQLTILGIGIFFLTSFMFVVERIKNVNDVFVFVVWVGMVTPAVILLINLIRMIKFFLVIRHEEGQSSIWRSALSLLISPLSIGIYYLIFFILMIASCSAGA